MTEARKKSLEQDRAAHWEGSAKPGGRAKKQNVAKRAAADSAGRLLRLKAEALEATGLGVIITDRQGNIVCANRSMQDLTGYTPEEMIGENPRLFNSGRQTTAFYKQLWDTILAGQQWHGHLINRRKDGSFYTEQLAITPVRDARGEISHFIAIKHDVTVERREQERARLLTQAVENSSEFVCMSNTDGVMMYANPAALRFLGYTSEEAFGKNVSSFYSPNNPPSLADDAFKKTMNEGSWHGEALMINGKGLDATVEVSKSRVMDDRGRIVGLLSIARDVTNQKQLAKALLERQEFFRQVADSIRAVFFIAQPDPARVTYMSPAYEEIWGRPCQELYREPDAWIFAIHPDDRERILPLFQAAQRGAKTDMEYRVVRPDGSIRWIRARTCSVHNRQGGVSHLVGFGEDVTERKKAEAELHDAQEKLNLALAQTQRRALVSERLTELVDLVQCCHTDQQAYQIVAEVLGSIFDSCDGALCITSPSRDIVEAVALWGNALDTECLFSPGDCWASRRGKTHAVKDASSPVRCPHVHHTLKTGHVCVPLMAQGETLGLLYLQGRSGNGNPGQEWTTGVLAELIQTAEAVGERVSLALANLKLRQILRSQSVRDPLTGLFNRRYMEETLDRELSRASRRNEAVAVAMCDLDHFKEFNDTFGHEAGDLVLRELSNLLQMNIRQGDIPCRFGGEEFVLIFPEATAEIAYERSESLREHVKALALSYRGRTLGKITISIGIAMYPEDGASFEELIRACDQALYRAKTDGRDRVVLSCPVR